MSAAHEVAIDAALERTGPGIFVAHDSTPVCVTISHREDFWTAVPWDSGDNDYGMPKQAYRSRTKRRAMESAAYLIDLWRNPVKLSLAPSLTSPAEREHFE